MRDLILVYGEERYGMVLDGGKGTFIVVKGNSSNYLPPNKELNKAVKKLSTL